MIVMSDCLVCEVPLRGQAALEKGEIVECHACGQEHEVVSVHGDTVSVELAPEIEEDWGE